MGTIGEAVIRLQNGTDVRGAAIAANGEERTLTPGLVTFITAAFELWLSRKTGKNTENLRIGIGHDSRVTADEMEKAVCRGFASADLYLCGLITTPAMFQSTVLPETDFDGSVMITASHLPFNRNGLKFFTKEGSLGRNEMSAVLEEAAENAERNGEPDETEIVRAPSFRKKDGGIFVTDMAGIYAGAMMRMIRSETGNPDAEKPLAGLHIVEDAGNGAAGFFASRILEPLGADVSGSVCLEPDGHFPNHVPNPENKAAMDSVRQAVLSSGADLGVIFDCDGDRGAVVFPDGTEVNRNSLIALLSAIVSEKYPGSTVVTDSCTSDELTDFLENRLGLVHFRFRRGYKNVIDKGIEINAEGGNCDLAIETSGHGAFRENYFSDDGAYIAVRIISKMACLKREGGDIRSLISGLKQPAESREIRFRILDSHFREYGENVLRAMRAYADEDPRFHVVEPNYEGIRVSFDDPEVKGWFLLRMSLHDPVMPMNAESAGRGGTDIILRRLQPFFERFPALSL